MHTSHKVQAFIGALKIEDRIIGSAFIVHCQEQEILIATCYHIVKETDGQDAELYFQLFSEPQKLPVKLVEWNAVSDAALLSGVNLYNWDINVPELISSEGIPITDCLIQGHINPDTYNDSRQVEYASFGGRIIGPDMRDEVEWLKLDISNALPGLSGAPVMLENPIRIVGIQSETYFGAKLKNVAWAIQIEELIKLDYRLRFTRDKGQNDIITDYLKGILHEYNDIYLPAIKERKSIPKIPLERVYVALKVHSKSSSYELNNAQKILDRKFQNRVNNLGYEPTEEEAQRIYSELVQENPKLRAWDSSFQENFANGDKNQEKQRVITLGRAFQDERYLVILGDPGSGKSTLAKWLAIKLAKAYLAELELRLDQRVVVPKNQIEVYEHGDGEMEDLGPARIPIFVRVSEYAKYYEEHNEKERSLIHYLGYGCQVSNHSHDSLNTCFQNHLKKGKAVVIIDGMDEVTRNRSKIIREIEKFIDLWINERGKPDDYNWDHATLLSPPVETGGNQIIITSRIVGYHSAPLSGNLTHVTIERMEEKAIRHFCDLWTEQVYWKEYQYELDVQQITELAKEEANALKEAIFDDSKPLVRDLATNPLLVTILALVFRNQNRKLPQSRAELYERALTILVEKWRENIPISQEELRSVLAPLAAKIHSGPTDDIHENELISLVEKHLAFARGYSSTDRIPIEFSEDVRIFLKRIREDVGILTERANNLYHFLHRTFQEYLAGQYLIGNKRTAPRAADIQYAKDNILTRVSDPIWREPILLGLGAIDLNWPEAQNENLINELLAADDPLKDLVPRSALFVANAITEMSRLNDNTIEIIIIQLLNAYTDRKRAGRFEGVQVQVEKVLQQLYKSDKKNVLDNIIENVLKEDHPTELQLGVIHLIEKSGWWNTQWLPLMFQLISIDSAEWNWPIEKILRKHFCVGKSNNSFSFLRFKNSLKKHPKWVEIIRNSVDWTRLLTTLYGGWEEMPLAEKYLLFKSYNWKLDKQQESEEERHKMAVRLDTELGSLKPLYNNWLSFSPDHIYREAPFTRDILRALSRKREAKEMLPFFMEKFQSSNDHNERVEALLALFALGQDVEQLIVAKGNEEEEYQPLINHFLQHLERLQLSLKLPLTTFFAYLDKNLKVINKTSLVDLPDQRKQEVIDTIIEAHNQLKIPMWQMSYNIPEKRFITRETSNESLIYYQNAEYLISTMSAYSSDPYYNTMVALDVKARVIKGELDAFLETILRIPFSRSHQNVYRYKWKVPKYIFNYTTVREKLILAFEIIQGIPEKYMLLREWMIVALGPLYTEDKGLYLYAFISAYPTINASVEQHAFFDQLALNDENIIDALKEKITELEDPYIQFQALLHLYRMEPDFDLKRSMMDSFSAVSYPLDQIKATMQLIEEFSGKEEVQMEKLLFRRGNQVLISFELSLILNAISRIDEIEHADNKVIAMLMIGAIHPEGSKNAYLYDALDLLPEVKPERKRAILVKNILEDYKTFVIDYPDWEKIANSFEDIEQRNIAFGKHYLNLFALDDDVSSGEMTRLNSSDLSEEESFSHSVAGLWAILTLYGATIDVQKLLSAGKGKKHEKQYWNLLFSPSRKEAALANILESGIEGIRLTKEVVDIVDKLLEAEDLDTVTKLLPLLEYPTANSWPTIEKWKDSQESILVNFYYLLKAENKIYNDETILSLVKLLSSKEDRLRCRAGIAIHGSVPDAGNENREIFTSEIGLDTLISIYQHRLDIRLENPAIAQTIGWINLNLAHNDPELIDVIVEMLNSSSSEDAIQLYRIILEDIQYVSYPVWKRLMHHLQTNSPDIQKSILKVLVKFAYIGGKKKTHWPFNAWQEITEIISEYHLEALNEMKLTDINFDNVHKTLYEVKAKEGLSPEQEIAYCNTYFDELSAITFPSYLLNDLDKDFQSSLFQEFKRAGKGMFIQPDIILRESHEWAQKLIEEPQLLGALFEWTINTLDDELIDMNAQTSYKGGKLALLAAATAVLVPDTYAELIDNKYAESILAEVVMKHPVWIARQGGITLLACLSDVTEQTVIALEHSLKDVDYVQDQAVRSYRFFKRFVGQKSLQRLFKNVHEGYGLLAKISAHIIVEVVIANNIDMQYRKKVIDNISSALRVQLKTNDSNKFVYILESSNTLQQKPKYLGRLDDCFYNELIRLIGL